MLEAEGLQCGLGNRLLARRRCAVLRLCAHGRIPPFL